VPAEPFEVAEEEEEADAPGDGTQRQVVPGQAQSDGTDHQRRHQGEHESDDEPAPGGALRPGKPCRQILRRGDHGGGVGSQADEGGLAEAGEPADAGEQHQAQGHEGVEGDVVEQAHLERTQHERREDDHGDEGREHPARGNASPAGERFGGGKRLSSFFLLLARGGCAASARRARE